MRSVNIREARKRLSDIVDAAEQGESILITRHGKEVARIEPACPTRGEPLPDLSAFRASIRSKGKSLSKTVVAARRHGRF